MIRSFDLVGPFLKTNQFFFYSVGYSSPTQPMSLWPQNQVSLILKATTNKGPTPCATTRHTQQLEPFKLISKTRGRTHFNGLMAQKSVHYLMKTAEIWRCMTNLIWWLGSSLIKMTFCYTRTFQHVDQIPSYDKKELTWFILLPHQSAFIFFKQKFYNRIISFK